MGVVAGGGVLYYIQDQFHSSLQVRASGFRPARLAIFAVLYNSVGTMKLVCSLLTQYRILLDYPTTY